MSKKHKKVDIDDIVKKIDNDQNEKHREINSIKDIDINKGKRRRNSFLTFCSLLVFLSSVIYLISILFFNKENINLMSDILKSLLMLIFSISFMTCLVSYPGKKKFNLVFGSLIIIIYNVFGILTNYGLVKLPLFNQVDNFSGKSLTEAVKWAEKNKITLVQDYENSDMIDEYYIINQDVKAGANIKNIKSLKIAVSEGPNLDKEIIVPDMVTWDCDRVLEFIDKNKLSNVDVKFEESDKVKDTVISQSKSGSLKRSDNIELTFSLGDENKFEQFNMKNLVGLSKFETEFYLKQHQIDYEIKNDFSNKYKKGYTIKQSLKAGEKIKEKPSEKITITISRGPEIKVPDLKKMNMTEVTNWIIKNKLKLEFKNKYDDSVKLNKVIDSNYKNGDKVEQGEVISVTISKGKLKMPKFKSLDEFKEWAGKYEINYNEEHEYSDTVKIGEVIEYSYKTGEVIKNDKSITVKISDGKKIEVPDLSGMSKNDIINKLKNLNLGYSFVYQNSSKVQKDKAISQSISSGSNVSEGTSVTVILSNGKKEEEISNTSTNVQKKTITKSSSTNKISSSISGGTNNQSVVNNTPSTPQCVSSSVTLDRSMSSCLHGSSYEEVRSCLSSYFSSKGVKVSIIKDTSSGMSGGSYISGVQPGSVLDTCKSYSITIAGN